MTGGEAVSIALGIVSLAAPFVWKEMSPFVSYPLIALGLLLLAFGAILIYRDRRRVMPPGNKIGDIKRNSGIVMQGQTGDNVIIRK